MRIVLAVMLADDGLALLYKSVNAVLTNVAKMRPGALQESRDLFAIEPALDHIFLLPFQGRVEHVNLKSNELPIFVEFGLVFFCFEREFICVFFGHSLDFFVIEDFRICEVLSYTLERLFCLNVLLAQIRELIGDLLVIVCCEIFV